MKTFLDLNLKDWLIEILNDLVCGLVFGLSVLAFARPNHIAPGGFTGLSIILNHIFGWPIGRLYLLLNLPILLIGWWQLDHKVLIRSLKTSVIISLIMDNVLVNIPKYSGDTILASLFYGVLAGFSLSLVYRRGGSTGGSDFIMLMLKKHFPHLETGGIILLLDGTIIAIAALVFKDIDTALYGVLATFTSSRVIDAILYGVGSGKLLLIYTNIGKTVSSAIMERVGRGVTIVPAIGAYTQNGIDLVLCGTRKTQVWQVKKIVEELDPIAIVMILEANEILGEGFLGIST